MCFPSITQMQTHKTSVLKIMLQSCTKFADLKAGMEGRRVIKSAILWRKLRGKMYVILLLYMEWRNMGLKEIREWMMGKWNN